MKETHRGNEGEVEEDEDYQDEMDEEYRNMLALKVPRSLCWISTTTARVYTVGMMAISTPTLRGRGRGTPMTKSTKYSGVR